ncbi:hypothetical protein Tco_1063313, partial [Tanacetum coccineum]
MGGCSGDEGGGGFWRVKESDTGDLIDREMGVTFGLAGKIPPENFSGGGGVAGEDEWRGESKKKE